MPRSAPLRPLAAHRLAMPRSVCRLLPLGFCLISPQCDSRLTIARSCPAGFASPVPIAPLGSSRYGRPRLAPRSPHPPASTPRALRRRPAPPVLFRRTTLPDRPSGSRPICDGLHFLKFPPVTPLAPPPRARCARGRSFARRAFDARAGRLARRLVGGSISPALRDPQRVRLCRRSSLLGCGSVASKAPAAPRLGRYAIPGH